jgi:uroporphyrinogen-III synthase
MRAIVTRPAAQAATWVADLQRAGVDAVALPLIRIGPPADPAPVREAWRTLDGHALVFFVSANAVLHFFALRPPGAAWPAATRAAAPGPGTAAALQAQGLAEGGVVAPAADAPAFDSEALWARLQHERWAGRSVLVVRGEDGRDWLAEQLRGAGATVRYLAAYTRAAPEPDAQARALLAAARAAPAAFLWLFSSSEAVRHLQALWGGPAPPGARALASHPRIAEAARAAGFAEVLATAPDLAAVRRAIQGASIQSSAP